MAVKIPAFRKLMMSTDPNAPNWMGGLYSNLNLFGEQIQSLFVSGGTINLVQGQKFSTTFTTASDYTTNNTFQTISFRYNGAGKPDCFIIGNISRDDGVLITTSPTITSATLNQNTSPAQVVVNYISGLADSTKYTVMILAL